MFGHHVTAPARSSDRRMASPAPPRDLTNTPGDPFDTTTLISPVSVLEVEERGPLRSSNRREKMTMGDHPRPRAHDRCERGIQQWHRAVEWSGDPAWPSPPTGSHEHRGVTMGDARVHGVGDRSSSTGDMPGRWSVGHRCVRAVPWARQSTTPWPSRGRALRDTMAAGGNVNDRDTAHQILPVLHDSPSAWRAASISPARSAPSPAPTRSPTAPPLSPPSAASLWFL